MKKVLFTATVDSHIRQFHLPYLKWFKEHGYEVHVATNGNEEIPFCDVKHKISFERSPIKINNLKAIHNLKKIIEKEKFDIIHCHTPMGSVVTRVAAINARKKYRTKVIYTAHGFHFFKGAPLINWIVFYPIEFLLSNITDCIITINDEDYQLAKKNFHADKIELVYGVGINEEKFNIEMSKEEEDELKEELKIKEEDFVIIYPAELSKRKNQGMLLKAIQLLKQQGIRNIKVLLPGIDSMNGKYKKMAKKMKIEEQIIFLGYRKDIPKLMKLSNLAVSTSKQEGLPVNIMEAMFMNLPIIATNCRGNRDLIKNCLEIDDYKMLAKKIKESMKKYPYKVEYDIDKFKIEKILKKVEEIYEE